MFAGPCCIVLNYHPSPSSQPSPHSLRMVRLSCSCHMSSHPANPASWRSAWCAQCFPHLALGAEDQVTALRSVSGGGVGGDVEQLLLLMKNQARWRVLHAWPPIMYMCGWYYPYINEDKEAQGSLATCPRSHNWHVPKPGTEPSLCDSGEQPRTSWALLLPPGDQTQPEAPQAVFRLLYLPSRCLWASTAHAWISSSFHWS